MEKDWLAKGVQWFIYLLAIAFSLFHLWIAGPGIMSMAAARHIHLILSMSLVFLVFPLSKKEPRHWTFFVDVTLIILGVAGDIYLEIKEVYKMTSQKLKRIGLVGCGVIGSYIAKAATQLGFAKVDFVYDENREQCQKVPGAAPLEKSSDIGSREVDLVIEAATEKAVREIAPQVLVKGNLLIFSVTGLADDDFRKSLQELCKENNTRLYIPHGAILGLDGIYDGRSVIEEVTITTTKSPKSLGVEETANGVLYDGPTRGACKLFPRNVNVHAALAVVGLGFDRTRSIVVADPKTSQMAHEIHVKGAGLEWNIRISSRSLGGVTGSYTPESAAMTVRRILANDYDIVLA